MVVVCCEWYALCVVSGECCEWWEVCVVCRKWCVVCLSGEWCVL